MTALEAEPPLLMPGQEIAPGYQVVEHLSRGQALDVYEVFSSSRLCSCVAKVVRPDRVEVSRVRERLLREGQLLQHLAHPHLPRAFETLEAPEGRGPVVIVETLVGLTLEEIVAWRRRRLPARDLAHLGRQLASALHYLHDHGYLHLDVRPSNVVSRAGIAVLIDLSLARPPGAVPRGAGTREYLAPEQAAGGQATPATDAWGLGATLYEAATGTAPFAPRDAHERRAWDAHAYLQLARSAPPLSASGRRLPRDLTEVISACLDPDPGSRPRIDDIYHRLGGVVADEDGGWGSRS